MKTFKYLICSVLFLIPLVSCNKTEGLNRDLDTLESRILALEESVTDINNNAVAIKNLLDKDIVITSFKQSEYGYEMTLSNGQTVTVVYGKEAPSLVPIIGIDGEGNWIASIDGGKTFTKIEKSVGPYDNYGATPQVKVDADGYWTVSVDGGRTWARLLGNNGLPLSAVDGREVAGKYAFFSNVSVDEEASLMVFHLVTGEEVTVPIVCGSTLIVKDYTPKEKIFSGSTLTFDVELIDVASAAWLVVPDGWEAKLGSTSMTIKAPAEYEDGEYSLLLTTISRNGLASRHEFIFTYESYILFDDFEEGTIPNPKYWELCPRKYTTGWSMYMSESYENTYLEDGKLVLVAEKKNGVYWSAGLQTKFGFEKCRVELSAKFTRMVTSGINSAAWLFPYSRMTWPYGGEVDIFEHLNNMPNLWQTCHTHYSVDLGGDPDDKHRKVEIDPTIFNTYTMDLTKDAVIFYINGKETFRYADKHFPDEEEKMQYPFYKSDFYLLMDCCLGTEWPGPIKDEDLPGIMEVDWVKISKLD